MKPSNSKQAQSGIFAAAAVLPLLIQLGKDWYWTSDTLMLGLVPVSIFAYGCVAIGATSAWYKVTGSGWPLIVALITLLLVVHQDNWLWDNDGLVYGFMPMALFWHAGISIAAALTWYLAIKIAWPVEQGGDETSSANASSEGGE